MAATDIHWTNGAADNLWATAGNWDGGVPAATDTAYLGTRSVADVTGASVVVAPLKCVFSNYSGSFGESGNPVSFDAGAPFNMTLLELKGSGKFFITTDADVTIDNCVVASTQRTATNIVLESANHTNLYLLMGAMTLSGTVVDIYQEYLSNRRANSSLIVSSGATVTNHRQSGGRSTLSKTLTGDLHLTDGATCTYSIGDVGGTAFIGDGSRLVYNSSGGDLDSVEVFARGILDYTQSQNPRTITTSCIVHAGGKIDAQGVETSVTITPTLKQIGAGATVLPASLGTRLVIQPGGIL